VGKPGPLGSLAARDISQAIERARRSQVATEKRRRALAPYGQALKLLDQGKDYVLQSTREAETPFPFENLLKAAQLLEEALRQDDTFPEAAAKLAWSYRMAAEYDERMWPKALAMAGRALAADPGSADANFVRGYVSMFREWDFRAAAQSLEQCIRRSILDQGSWRLYAGAMCVLGRAEEARKKIVTVLSVLPASVILRYALFGLAEQTKDLAEIERLAREMPKSGPSAALGEAMLASAFHWQGRHREAEQLFHGILSKDPRNGKAITRLALLYVSMGKLDRAAAAVESADGHRRWPILVGVVEAARGNRLRALGWVERAVRERDPNLPYATLHPHFDRLRSEPLCAQLLKQFSSGGWGSAHL